MQKEIRDLYKLLGEKYNLPEYVIEEIVKTPMKHLKDSMFNHERTVLHLMLFGKFAPKSRFLIKREKENGNKTIGETISDKGYGNKDSGESNEVISGGEVSGISS